MVHPMVVYCYGGTQAKPIVTYGFLQSQNLDHCENIECLRPLTFVPFNLAETCPCLKAILGVGREKCHLPASCLAC